MTEMEKNVKRVVSLAIRLTDLRIDCGGENLYFRDLRGARKLLELALSEVERLQEEEERAMYVEEHGPEVLNSI